MGKYSKKRYMPIPKKHKYSDSWVFMLKYFLKCDIIINITVEILGTGINILAEKNDR